METITSSRRSLIWLGAGVVFVSVALVLFFVLHGISPTSIRSSADESKAEFIESQIVSKVDELIQADDVLVFVDMEWGDVLESCAISEYIHPTSELEAARSFVRDLELTQNCIEALEQPVLSLNPFTRYGVVGSGFYEFSLVRSETPMTYERIFANPEDDLTQVLDALSRRECLMSESTANKWGLNELNPVPTDFDVFNVANLSALGAYSEDSIVEKSELKESCHADAFVNYAAFYDACYRESAFGYFVNLQTQFIGRELNPEQIRSIWKGYLAQHWVGKQCQEFSSSLELNDEQYSEIFPFLLQIGSFRSASRTSGGILVGSSLDKDTLYFTLLSFGAQFGDEAASFAFSPSYYWNNQPWRPILEKLKRLKRPNPERLLTTLELVAALDSAEIDYDLEWLVDHICTIDHSIIGGTDAREEQRNCRSLINELYINLGTVSSRDLQTLTKIERIAIELDVYD